MPFLNSSPCLSQPVRLRAYIAAGDILIFVEGPNGWDLLPENRLGWDKLFGKDCWEEDLHMEIISAAGFDLNVTTVLFNSYLIAWEGASTKSFFATGQELDVMKRLGARIEIEAVSQAAQSETVTTELIIPPHKTDGSGS